jgi:hypothetical protein
MRGNSPAHLSLSRFVLNLDLDLDLDLDIDRNPRDPTDLCLLCDSGSQGLAVPCDQRGRIVSGYDFTNCPEAVRVTCVSEIGEIPA